MTGKEVAILVNEVKTHLKEKLIPFWMNLRDDKYGGYCGYLDFDLKPDKRAEKGCILNSRILWFFSKACKLFESSDIYSAAEHAYKFLLDSFIDKEKGGVYWSVTYDGKPLDTTKHVYSHAFAIYALSAYYDISGDERALELCREFFELIEKKMSDEGGYLEAFDRNFEISGNDKLSENGVEAARTMNTILHVMEAYTEYYRVFAKEEVRERLIFILEIFLNKIYAEDRHRLKVFFDRDYNSLIDLYSYGHDIEAAWLINLTVDVLEYAGSCSYEKELFARIRVMTKALSDEIYKEAYDGKSIPAEAENGVVKQDRIWWVQAEGINGFLDAYLRDKKEEKYLRAAEELWQYISEFIIDPRDNSEWYWYVDQSGKPAKEPIVEPWKCPYHNGRMCFEIINRME